MIAPRGRSIAIAYDCLFPLSTGGGERQYRAFAEQFHRRGFRVDYLTATQWDADTRPRQPEFAVVPVTRKLTLYDAHGVRRTVAAVQFAWGLFRYLLHFRRRYDAVMVSGLPVLNVFAARAALWGSGTSVIVDYLEVWGARQWREYAGEVTGRIAWFLQKMAILLTPIATCHSQLSGQRLRAEGLRSAPVVSPGLIDGESAAAFNPQATSPPFVIYAGRHIADKRVECLPAAVAHARESIPELELVILGDGASTPEVHREITRVQGEPWIRLPGFVSQDTLDELMSKATCLANPSRREGYGLVVVEANAHGTPVVLVDDPGNAATELIDEGTNGFISPGPQPAALGTAIVAAVRGGDALRARARNWYDNAVKTRTVERTIDAIIDIIDVTASATRPSRRRSARRQTEEGPS